MAGFKVRCDFCGTVYNYGCMVDRGPYQVICTPCHKKEKEDRYVSAQKKQIKAIGEWIAKEKAKESFGVQKET